MRRLLLALASAAGSRTPSLTLLVVAAVVGAATTGLLVLAGLVTTTARFTVPLISLTVPAVVVTFLVISLLALIVAVALARSDSESLREQWQARSLWTRATLVGFVCTLALVSLIAVNLPSKTHRIALGATGALATWPLCTAAVVLRARRSTGPGKSRIRATLVSIGYAQLRGVERRTLAVFVGGVTAVFAGIVAAFLGQHYTGRVSPLTIVTVGIVVWIAVTILAYDRYAPASDRGLTVRDIRYTESKQRREMSIRNDSDLAIDLAGCSVRDTEHARYRIDVDRRLGPGESCTLAVPASFSLAPEDAAVELPLGYTLERGSDFPVVFGRTGERFRLRPETPEAADRA